MIGASKMKITTIGIDLAKVRRVWMSVAVRYLQTWKRALQGWKLAEAICEAAGLANMRFVAKDGETAYPA